MQTGRQADRQTSKGKEKKRREEKRRKKKISISPPKHGESFLLCFAVPSILSLSLSLSPYYLTLMHFSFGVDDTSFAPFFD